MKELKPIRLFESYTEPSSLTNRSDIEDWLDKHRIQNYNIHPDTLIVSVIGSVDLAGFELTHIPIKFGRIDGYFTINNNKISNLDFCPYKVRGYFSCRHNKLVTFEGAPSIINGAFYGTANSKLVSWGIDSKIKYKYTVAELGDIEERIITYVNYLSNDKNPLERLDWMRKVDSYFYDQVVRSPHMIEYALKNGIELGLSDDVKNIAGAALKGNHKLR